MALNRDLSACPEAIGGCRLMCALDDTQERGKSATADEKNGVCFIGRLRWSGPKPRGLNDYIKGDETNKHYRSSTFDHFDGAHPSNTRYKNDPTGNRRGLATKAGCHGG